jgi:hypothetical protein
VSPAPPLRGVHYGAMPSFTGLEDANMRYTTDFHQIHATTIRSWLGCPGVGAGLKDEFTPLDTRRT